MKYVIAGKNVQVDLNQSHFKAAGGEGQIFIKGQTVYKVCDPGKMIPEGKFRELSVLSHPRIIKPEEILLNTKNQPIGYTMRLVPNAIPLAQILTKIYREREGVTLNIMLNLIQQMREGIQHVHDKGLLQVDGNEMNYMVTKSYDDVYFIDVNSYETPHYPAEVLMLSIRDWHVETKGNRCIWTKNSDWFSFAVLSFYMFTGIHPYKGRHPKFTNMKTMMVDQMKANISVLDSESVFPKAAAYPFDVIPDAYMQWFKAVLVDGKRLPPPKDFQAKIEFIAQIKNVVGNNNFNIEELYNFVDYLTGFYSHNNQEVAVTKDEIFYNRKAKIKPSKSVKIGFTPITRTPIVAWIEDDLIKLKNLKTDLELPFSGGGSDLMSCDGRLYVRSETRIYEINFIESGSSHIMAAPKVVSDVVEQGTQLFQGVVIQNMFDGYFISIFPESGYCYQLKIVEFEKYRILEAKYEHNVLMVIGIKDGQYDRFIMRFSKEYDSYDLRKIENISFTGINFTVLDNGICISLTEEEKIEVFSCQKDSKSIKSIDDPVIEADMKLCHNGSQFMFAKGGKLYQMSMK